MTTKTQNTAAVDHNSDITEIAKAVRKDIRTAVKAGRLPAMKTSVRISRFSGGQSLSVEVKTIACQVQTDAYLAAVAADRYHFATNVDRFTAEATSALETLEAIVDAYRWDNSDPQTDYFNCNFYKHVSFATEVTESERNAAINAPTAHVDAYLEHEATIARCQAAAEELDLDDDDRARIAASLEGEDLEAAETAGSDDDETDPDDDPNGGGSRPQADAPAVDDELRQRIYFALSGAHRIAAGGFEDAVAKVAAVEDVTPEALRAVADDLEATAARHKGVEFDDARSRNYYRCEAKAARAAADRLEAEAPRPAPSGGMTCSDCGSANFPMNWDGYRWVCGRCGHVELEDGEDELVAVESAAAAAVKGAETASGYTAAVERAAAVKGVTPKILRGVAAANRATAELNLPAARRETFRRRALAAEAAAEVASRSRSGLSAPACAICGEPTELLDHGHGAIEAKCPTCEARRRENVDTAKRLVAEGNVFELRPGTEERRLENVAAAERLGAARLRPELGDDGGLLGTSIRAARDNASAMAPQAAEELVEAPAATEGTPPAPAALDRSQAAQRFDAILVSGVRALVEARSEAAAAAVLELVVAGVKAAAETFAGVGGAVSVREEVDAALARTDLEAHGWAAAKALRAHLIDADL